MVPLSSTLLSLDEKTLKSHRFSYLQNIFTSSLLYSLIMNLIQTFETDWTKFRENEAQQKHILVTLNSCSYLFIYFLYFTLIFCLFVWVCLFVYLFIPQFSGRFIYFIFAAVPKYPLHMCFTFSCCRWLWTSSLPQVFFNKCNSWSAYSLIWNQEVQTMTIAIKSILIGFMWILK